MAFWFIDLLIKFDHQYLSMKTKNILKFHLLNIIEEMNFTKTNQV